MELKGRLRLIAENVPECRKICDIGTDHAYIPIYLVKNRVCELAVASDVKKGPIEAAQRNICQYGLQDVIETRLGYGLETISPGECETAVIAGMGGILISQILEKSIGVAKAAELLVLQPQNSIDILRRWLYQSGFDILDEQLTNEGEKIYGVILSKWVGKTTEIDEIYYYIGEKLIDKKDALLDKYIAKVQRRFNKIIAGIGSDDGKKAEIDHYLRLIDAIEQIKS
ncbi:MAG TPA: class I SAM-dependent methyltransferase [Clostridia bacterium]